MQQLFWYPSSLHLIAASHQGWHSCYFHKLPQHEDREGDDVQQVSTAGSEGRFAIIWYVSQITGPSDGPPFVFLLFGLFGEQWYVIINDSNTPMLSQQQNKQKHLPQLYCFFWNIDFYHPRITSSLYSKVYCNSHLSPQERFLQYFYLTFLNDSIFNTQQTFTTCMGNRSQKLLLKLISTYVEIQYQYLHS